MTCLRGCDAVLSSGGYQSFEELNPEEGGDTVLRNVACYL
jgi:hypothetical protein